MHAQGDDNWESEPFQTPTLSNSDKQQHKGGGDNVARDADIQHPAGIMQLFAADGLHIIVLDFVALDLRWDLTYQLTFFFNLKSFRVDNSRQVL